MTASDMHYSPGAPLDNHDPVCVFNSVRNATCLPAFGKLQMRFAGAFSEALFRCPNSRRHGELIALAYWLRENNLNRLTRKLTSSPGCIPAPRGIVFHVCPGNVDSIFVYSWMLSLLCGNRNVLKISSRETEVQALLLQMIEKTLENPDFAAVRRMNMLVRFSHEAGYTEYLSSLCDMRVLWGGDHSVTEIRRFPLQPHANEITFSDRWSFSLLKATSVAELDSDAIVRLSEAICNDCWTFGQLACSSPRALVFVGSAKCSDIASKRLYKTIAEVLKRGNYPARSTDLANGRAFAEDYAMKADAEILELGMFTVVRCATLCDAPLLDHCGGGFFFESTVQNPLELQPAICRKFQTVTHFGFSNSELNEWIPTLSLNGIDRWMPIGKALDFDTTWDGNDLLSSFCRLVRVDYPVGDRS